MTLDAPATPPADLIEVGRVVDAWGVRGWVRIEPLSPPGDSVLLTARDWWLFSRTSATPRALRVTRCRVHGDVLVAKPSGFEDRDQALALRSASIHISRATFPPAAPGEFYWVDLIGCDVSNTRGESLGVVDRIEDHGAHPILFVVAGERTLLIPFVEQIVSGVDIDAKRLCADWEADY